MFRSSGSMELWGGVPRGQGDDVVCRSQSSETQRQFQELENVCASLREQLNEKNRKFDLLQEELKFQTTLAQNYQSENERLLSEIKKLKKPEICKSCEDLHAQIANLNKEISDQNAKLSNLANESIISASLAQDLSAERLANAELRMEISRLKKTPEKNAKIFKILHALEQTIKSAKSPDDTLVSVFEAMKKMAIGNPESEISDDLWRAKLVEVENIWTAKLQLLKAEHEKIRLDYESALRQQNRKFQTEISDQRIDRSAQARIDALERELQMTNQLFAKKLGTSETAKTTPVIGHFYIANSVDLRLFLALPLARALGDLLTSQDRAVRKLVERTLQSSSIREELMEEALREACEETDSLEVVVADMEMNGIGKWREMKEVMTRCGIDSALLERKISEFPELKIDTKRLLSGRTRDVKDQIIGG